MILEVPELNEFPANPAVGDIVYIVKENKIYFYNGSEWIEKEYPASLPDKYVVRDRLTQVRYLARDWASFVNSLRIFLKERFPDYEDWLESDLGMALIDVIAYGLDNLAWYQDKIASELFVDTACLRKNVYRLARQLGYTPRGVTAAQVLVDIQLAQTYQFDVVIPKGHRFYASDLVFELANNVLISRGRTRPSEDEKSKCIVIEGKTKRREYVSNGGAWQKLFLDVETGYKLANGVKVFVAGEEWEEVDNWTYTVGKEYKVFYEDKPYVLFGDGVVAKIPERGASIVVEYRICKGSLGNISQGRINRADNLVIKGQTISLIVSNPQKGYGGCDEESIEEIKINIKRNFLAQDRAVTTEDFEKLILDFRHPLGRIFKVKSVVAKGIEDDPYLQSLLNRVKALETMSGFRVMIKVYDALKSYLDGFFNSKRSVNLVLFYLLSKDENGQYISPPAEYLLDDETRNPLLKYINEKKVLTVQVKFLDGTIFVRKVKANIELKVAAGYDFEKVKGDIKTALLNFADKLNFGDALRISDVYGVIEQVEGVDYCYVDLSCEGEGVRKNQKGDIVPDKGLILMIDEIIINEVV